MALFSGTVGAQISAALALALACPARSLPRSLSSLLLLLAPPPPAAGIQASLIAALLWAAERRLKGGWRLHVRPSERSATLGCSHTLTHARTRTHAIGSWLCETVGVIPRQPVNLHAIRTQASHTNPANRPPATLLGRFYSLFLLSFYSAHPPHPHTPSTTTTTLGPLLFPPPSLLSGRSTSTLCSGVSVVAAG